MNKKSKASNFMNSIKVFILVTWALLFMYPSYWHLFIGPTINRYNNLYVNDIQYNSITFPFSDLIHSYKFPIHNFSIKGKIDLLQKLLTTNKDVNTKDGNGSYPLEYACCFNHAYLAKLLLDNGADITLCKSYNPLNSTIVRRNYALLDMLSKNKADWNKKCSKEKYTPLQLAIKQRNVKAIEIAIKHKADLTQKSIHGVSTLDQAIINNNLEVVAAFVIGGVFTENHIEAKSPLIKSYLKLCKETENPKQSLKFIQAQIKLAEQQKTTKWKYMPELPINTKIPYSEMPPSTKH